MPTTGQRIKARRMNAKFAASVGAKACGVTTQQYYNYENSKTLPRIEQLVNLAERYRCDVEHLKGDDWKGEEPVEESTKEEETLKKEPETATLEEAAEKIDQLKEHIRHLNDIIRDHEKETDKLKEELSEAKERRALPIDYSKTQGFRDSEVEIPSKVFEVEKNYLVIENDGQRGPGDAAPVALLDAEAINRRPSANAPAAPKKEPPSIAKDRLIKDYQAHIKELEFVIDHLEQDKKKLKEIIIALAIKQLVQGEEGWKNVLRDLI